MSSADAEENAMLMLEMITSASFVLSIERRILIARYELETTDCVWPILMDVSVPTITATS